MFGDAHSRQNESSMLNQTGIKISVDPTLTYPCFHTCMPFNSVQDISKQKNCVMCLEERRKKETSVYCGLCTILSYIEN